MKKENSKKIDKKKITCDSVYLEVSGNNIKACFDISKEGKKYYLLSKQSFGEASEENIADSLKELCKKHDLRPKRAYLNLPKFLVITRFLRLPSVKNAEIADMVRNEAIKQIPYSEDEIISRHRLIQKFKDGYSSVYLALVKQDTLKTYINGILKAGLNIEFIALSSEALFAWYAYELSQAKTKIEGVYGVINIDADHTEIIIGDNNNLAFTRMFATKQDLQANILEVQRSLSIFQKESNKTINKLVVTGSYGKTTEIIDGLQKAINVEVEFIDPARNIKLFGDSATLMADMSYVDLVGIAEKQNELQMNLMTEKLIQSKKAFAIRKGAFKSFLFLTLFLVLIFAAFAKHYIDRKNILEFVDAQMITMKPKVDEALKIKKDIEILRGEFYKSPLAVETLGEIYKITPSGIVYNMIEYDSSGSLILRGYAQDLKNVIGFISTIEKSDVFQNASIKYTSKRNIKGKTFTDFEIICSIKAEQ